MLYFQDPEVGGLMVDRVVSDDEPLDDGLPMQEDYERLMALSAGRDFLRAVGNEQDFAAVGWEPTDSPFVSGIGARCAAAA